MKCPRTVNDGKDKCPWVGDLEDFPVHTAESGHEACLTCRYPLRDTEVRVCGRCVTGAHDDLDVIETAFARLHSVAEARSSGSMPGGDALVLLAGGSLEGGGPDDHVKFNDPIPVLVQLHFWERDWRETFGHAHFPQWQATVTTTLAYLREWMWLAARTHEAFEDYLTEIRALANRVGHVVGIVDDPRKDPIPCACGGKLLQDYGDRGLEEERWCRDCGTVYPPDTYAMRRLLVTETPGWVSEVKAAEMTERPVVTIKAWVKSLDLPSVCHRLTRRVLVDAEAVQELHEERQTRKAAS